MSYGQPPPPPPPGYGGQPAYGAPAPAGTNKKAIWSLVLGILGLLCCGFIAGIPAILLSRQAKAEIAQTRQSGEGMATAGFVLGIIAVVWGVIYLILVLTGAINFNFETNT